MLYDQIDPSFTNMKVNSLVKISNNYTSKTWSPNPSLENQKSSIKSATLSASIIYRQFTARLIFQSLVKHQTIIVLSLRSHRKMKYSKKFEPQVIHIYSQAQLWLDYPLLLSGSIIQHILFAKLKGVHEIQEAETLRKVDLRYTLKTKLFSSSVSQLSNKQKRMSRNK